MARRRFLAVLLALAWGGAWAVATIISRQGPRYWDAVTPLDYAAVWSYSVALTVSAGVVWLTGGLARADRVASWLAAIIGSGLLVAAVANAVEDGVGIKSAGSIYVLGALIGGYGSFVLAAALAATRAPGLAVVAIATPIGALLLSSVGGYVVVVVSLWFAERLFRRPGSLAPRPRAAATDTLASSPPTFTPPPASD